MSDDDGPTPLSRYAAQGLIELKLVEPDPIHYARWERAYFKLMGRWPQTVVKRRLAQIERTRTEGSK